MVCHALSLIIPSNGYHLTMQSIDDLTARWETKKYTQLETPKRKPGGGKKAYKRTVLIALCLKALIGSGSSNSWNGSFKISLVTYGFWNWAHESCACLREILLISYSRLPLCSSASPPPTSFSRSLSVLPLAVRTLVFPAYLYPSCTMFSMNEQPTAKGTTRRENKNRVFTILHI